MAFLNDDTLDDTQYTGPLHYVAASKRILTDEEYSVEFNGTKIERQDKGAYYLESKEESNGQWKWLTINVVFAKPLPAREAYDFVEAEAERASRRGMDVDAYAKVGDRTIRTSRGATRKRARASPSATANAALRWAAFASGKPAQWK
jgi:hypothetical protein